MEFLIPSVVKDDEVQNIKEISECRLTAATAASRRFSAKKYVPQRAVHHRWRRRHSAIYLESQH